MMQPRSAGAARRLSDFLIYTQRFRVGLLVLGAAWFTATHLLGLTPESGLSGSWITGSVIGLAVVTWLIMPLAASAGTAPATPADSGVARPRCWLG